jgi:hypothetical protein
MLHRSNGALGSRQLLNSMKFSHVGSVYTAAAKTTCVQVVQFSLTIAVALREYKAHMAQFNFQLLQELQRILCQTLRCRSWLPI